MGARTRLAAAEQLTLFNVITPLPVLLWAEHARDPLPDALTARLQSAAAVTVARDHLFAVVLLPANIPLVQLVSEALIAVGVQIQANVVMERLQVRMIPRVQELIGIGSHVLFLPIPLLQPLPLPHILARRILIVMLI